MCMADKGIHEGGWHRSADTIETAALVESGTLPVALEAVTLVQE